MCSGHMSANGIARFVRTILKCRNSVLHRMYGCRSSKDGVAHLLFFRDVWIRTQRTAVASRRATNLPTHLPNLTTPTLP
jgi:hypothetical protein